MRRWTTPVRTPRRGLQRRRTASAPASCPLPYFVWPASLSHATTGARTSSAVLVLRRVGRRNGTRGRVGPQVARSSGLVRGRFCRGFGRERHSPVAQLPHSL